MKSPDYLIGEIPSILHTVTGFTPCDLQGKSRIIWSFSGVSFENPPFEVESANLDRNTSGREGGHLVKSISLPREHTNLDVMHALKFVSTISLLRACFLSNRGQMPEEQTT